jgi:hypothetical protein
VIEACSLALIASIVACFAVTAATVAIGDEGLGGLEFGLRGLAVYQFAYLWPWWRAAKRREHHEIVLGIKLAAGLTALVVGLCWSTFDHF